MKNKKDYTPLGYQITEYDCGQTTFLNAIRYIFRRDEISPGVIKTIMQYTLDRTNANGEIGKGGTSVYAIKYLANWLNEISRTSEMKIETKIIKNDDVNTSNGVLNEYLKQGGAAILRVWQTYEHYVLCTKIDKNYVYVFDPYYLDIKYYDNDEECEIIKNRPFEYNRKITRKRVDGKDRKDFSLVNGKNGAMLLLKRK